MRAAVDLVLTDEERTELTKLVGSRLTSVRPAPRARIPLLRANGRLNKDAAALWGIGD